MVIWPRPGRTEGIGRGSADNATLLAVEALDVFFGQGRRWAQVTNGISFAIRRGETLGLIGESGSGKTVTGLAILGLLPRSRSRVAGRILFEGEDLVAMSEARLRGLRGRRIGMIFQEPMTALDPVFTIGDQIAETLRAHFPITAREAKSRAVAALAEVGIPNPAMRAGDYPHQLSGGMCQRAMIAIALACAPDLLVADEPTTALDVTVQAQVIELLLKLVTSRGTALLFISHDLGVIAQSCERVIALYAGQVVEAGPVDAVLTQPLHPYSSGLLRSLPRFAAPRTPLAAIGGRVPAPDEMPPGCRFAPRCAHARPICDQAQRLEDATAARQVRCIRHGELQLPGALA
jgi:peptide/nickel transport system ATP-binding protein